MIATIKNLLKLSGLEGNDRILQFHVFDRCMNTWDKCMDYIQTIRERQNPEYSFFRDDYLKEVFNVIDTICPFVAHNDVHSFRRMMTINPDVTKRFLQHMYTCKETRPLYDILVDISKNIHDKDIIQLTHKVSVFRSEFENKQLVIKHSSRVDFGVCEYCVGWKIKVAREYRKEFKKLDTNLWNIFERSESSKPLVISQI